MKFSGKVVVTFVAVLAVVLGVAAVWPLLAGGSADADTPPEIEVENPQYSADRVAVDDTPGQATVQMDSSEPTKTVLIDTGPAVLERDIRPLVNALTSNGHEVRFHGSGQQGGAVPPGVPGRPAPRPSPGSEEPIAGSLEEAHALVTVGQVSYTPEDIRAVGTFAENDGRVLMLTEPEQSFSTATSSAALQSNLSVYSEPGYFYNLVENDMNHMRVFAEPDASSGLTEGVDRMVFSGATPVDSSVSSDVATVIDNTNLSTTRAPTDAAVMTRQDGVILVGDTDFMSPENTQRADNDVLVGNLADFLVTGDRELDTSDGQNESSGGDSVETITVGPDGEPRFEPEYLEIEPGTTVRFEWDSDGHTLVVSRQEQGGDWAGVPEPKEAGFVHEHTFEEPGAYEFTSNATADGEMVGVIIVGDPDLS